MNKSYMLPQLCACLFMLLTTISCNNTGNENRSASNNEIDDLSTSTSESAVDDLSATTSESTVKYVDSASIVVNEVWVRDANEKGFEEQLLLEPKEVRLVPASGDNAELIVDLMLPAGEYDQVRLVLGSGTVTLSDNVYVADGHLFSTDLGNLKFPSGYQSGIKEKIEPPIDVVTGLSQELILSFELADSFVFNGPATHAPGVKRVLFKPVIQTVNNSTHGRITLKVNGSGSAKCNADSVASAIVTAIDTSGVNEDISTTTNQFGDAVIKLLPGIYNILIEADGFEPVTIENNQVYIANKTEVGDVTLKEDDNPRVFNQDRAIFLASMSRIAYADGRFGGSDQNILEVDDEPGEGLPQLPDGERAYSDCWRLYRFLDSKADGEFEFAFFSSVQLFIAYHEKTKDIVVSFRGTDDGFDLGLWFTAAATVFESVPWIHRGGNLESTQDDELVLDAISNAWKRGYRGTQADLVGALDDAIDYHLPKESDDNPNPREKSRIYFTGHSYGGALATIAAVDLADYLIVKHDIKRENIIMYSYGGGRPFTERITETRALVTRNYQEIVPSSFAISAKDDSPAHFPPIRLSDGADPSENKYIENLIVLSTNIVDRGEKGGERYNNIGKSRLEPSNGTRFEGCNVSNFTLPADNLDIPPRLASAYGLDRGHDILQYRWRLEDLVDTIPLPNGNRNGFPAIRLGIVADPNPNLPPFGNERIKLIWDARDEDSVMGPCDWVALYKGSSRPTDVSDYECKSPLNADGFEWVVNGDGYRGDGTPLGISSHTTCVNPTNNLGSRFWIGYIDGFNRIINTRGPYINECIQFGGVLGNRCDKSRLVLQ